jgi:DNA-binding Lrp family transcriptional regulator
LSPIFSEIVPPVSSAAALSCGGCAAHAEWGDSMVNAIVLLNVESSRINHVAGELVELDGVSEVYSVAGQYDLVVVIRARDDEQIATLVTEQLLQVEGLLSSETLIAFRTFSRHDLDGMFSVGLD